MTPPDHPWASGIASASWAAVSEPARDGIRKRSAASLFCRIYQEVGGVVIRSVPGERWVSGLQWRLVMILLLLTRARASA
jgi:hypothetical protein